MNKKEIFAKIKLREQIKKDAFYNFVKEEGFIETVANNKAFGDTPLFYKQLTENKFFAFNIPYYGKVKSANFQSDFWLITALTKNEFLNHDILEQNLETILLGFDLEEDIELYKAQEQEIILEQNI